MLCSPSEKNVSTNDTITLDKYQSCFLKGFGIIIILLHNFFHWLPPKIGEHELGYYPKVTRMFFHLLNRYPQKFFHIIISYSGYIAISLFVFISGYGMVKKFHTSKHSLIQLVFSQVAKVYRLYLISVSAFVLFCCFRENPIPWRGLLRCLSLTNNFIPSRVFSINGPWWFFSLIIQLYIIFPLIYIFILKNKINFFLLLIGNYLFIYIVTFYFNIDTSYLYANFIGHIPEFSLGIFLSLFSGTWLYKKNIFILSVILFIFSLTNSFLHPFSFILGTVVLLFMGNELYCIPNKKIISSFYFLGTLSPFLFGIHGFLRKPFINTILNKTNGFSCSIAFLEWFLTCVLFSYCLVYLSTFKNK